MKKIRLTRDIVTRIVVVFCVSALNIIAAGSIVGIELWQAALMAGITSCAFVLEGLGRAYLHDGKLTQSEVDDVFSNWASPQKDD